MSSKKHLLCAVATFMFAAGACAQPAVPGVRNSISVQAGYGMAVGEWTEHPYAPVSFFRQNFVVGGDIAVRLSDNIAVAVTGLYSALNTADWENYALSQGDPVTSTASIGHVALVFRPYLRNTPPDLVSFDIGPAILMAGGDERTASRLFKYDFLGSTKFGLLAALEYDRCLGENIAVFVRVTGVYIPSALDYAGGWSPSLTTIPLTAGARIYF